MLYMRNRFRKGGMQVSWDAEVEYLVAAKWDVTCLILFRNNMS